MSLAIEIDDVSAVLLADGWHIVADDSFTIDSYEFVDGKDSRGDRVVVHGGGAEGICAVGFAFKRADETVICGPLTAVLAVRTD
jgi:hypothetical protein